METKLNCAIRASKELVTNLHRDGLDRGCIATFSDFLTIRQVKKNIVPFWCLFYIVAATSILFVDDIFMFIFLEEFHFR